MSPHQDPSDEMISAQIILTLIQFSRYLVYTGRVRTSTYETLEFPHLRDSQPDYFIWYCFFNADIAFLMVLFLS